MATWKQESDFELPQGHEYCVQFIYDYPPVGDATRGQRKAKEFVNFLTEKLQEWGISKYDRYEDARPGSNVFHEHVRATDKSVWTFLIITDDYTENSWHEFLSQSAYKRRLDNNNPDRTIPLLVGQVNFPVEFRTIEPLSFDSSEEKWKDCTKQLKKLREVLLMSFSARNPQDSTEEEKPFENEEVSLSGEPTSHSVGTRKPIAVVPPQPIVGTQVPTPQDSEDEYFDLT